MTSCLLPHCGRRRLQRQRYGASVEWIDVDCDCHCTLMDADFYFLRAMKFKRRQSIRGIYIHYADISDATGELIAQIVAQSSTIRECVITGGRITLSTYRAFAKALHTNTSLSMLRINLNDAYTPEVDALFLFALSVNSKRPSDSCWTFVDGKDDAYSNLSRQLVPKCDSLELPRLIDAYSSYWQPTGSRRRSK